MSRSLENFVRYRVICVADEAILAPLIGVLMPIIRNGARVEIAPFEDEVEQAPARSPETVTKRAARIEVSEAKTTATHIHRAAQGRGDPERAKAIRKASNKRKGRSTRDGLGAPLILAVLAQGKPVKRNALQRRFAEVGLSPQSVSGQLSKFKARGWVRQMGDGMWEATPRGLAAKEVQAAAQRFSLTDTASPSAPPAEEPSVELHGHFDDNSAHEQTTTS